MRILKLSVRLFILLSLLLFSTLSVAIFLPGSTGAKAMAAPAPGWTQQNTGITSPAVLYSVSAVSANIVWAAGYTPVYGEEATFDGVVIKTADGGTTWSKNLQVPGTIINRVFAVDENNVWVIGKSGLIMKTGDGGTTWQAQTSGTLNELKGIDALDASTLWVVGMGGTILKTVDGGLHWLPQASGTPNTLNSVSVIDSDNAWIGASSVTWAGTMRPPPFDNAPYYPILLRTTDGGKNWVPNQVGTYDEYFGDIGAAGATALAIGKDIVYSPIPIPVTIFDYPTYSALLPLGSYVLEITYDGGQGWSTPVGGLQVRLSRVAMVDANTVWVVGGSGIFKSNDGGTSWSPQDSGVPFGISDISAVDASTAWAVVGNPSVILKTTTGGFPLAGPPVVTSISPTEAGQYAFAVDLAVQGSGFQPGATLSLQKADAAINASVVAVSDTQINASVFLFGTAPGTYDVVVTNPDAQEAKLAGVFIVTSTCGSGSGSAILMLGLSLGLLSLGGIARKRRHRAYRDPTHEIGRAPS